MPTNDDLFGGIPSDDGADYIPGADLATAAGELRYHAGQDRFSLFDGSGEYDPRTGQPASVLPCFSRTLSSDLTIAADQVCMTHDIVIGAGVTLTIDATGELLNL